MHNRACCLLALLWMSAFGGPALSGVSQQAGVIVGRILDKDNEPFPRATVEALAPRAGGGPARFIPLASTQTDDHGDFRLAGLPAGEIYLRAFDPEFARVSGERSEPRQYSPTFYPGVVQPARATRVAVSGDAEPPRVLFSLQTVRLARVSGIMRTSDARQLGSGAVVLRPLADDGLAAVRSQDVAIHPDGTFTFSFVPPGDYEIRARGDVDRKSPSLFASFRVRVESRDVEHVDMTLVPGAQVEGRLVVDALRSGRPPRRFAGLRVRAPLEDGSPFGDALSGEVQANGAYAIRGIANGRHVITLEGLPDEWVVKSVTWGGRDITDDGVEAASGRTFADVRVTVTDSTTDLSGLVHDRSGAAVAEATVLVIPASRQFWTKTSRRLRVVHSDAAGRYRVRGLPPGEYRALASVDIEKRGIYEADRLEALSAAGIAISLKELSTHTVDLPLTPPSALVFVRPR